MSSESDRAQRARARADWPGIKTSLAEATDAADLSATTTAEERLAMMWPLALAAWTLSGQPLPSYTREQIPGRIIRRGEPVSAGVKER
jgi:hypothetical protein